MKAREFLIPMVNDTEKWTSVQCSVCGRNVKSNPETNELRPHRPGRVGDNKQPRRELRGLMCNGKAIANAPSRPRE